MTDTIKSNGINTAYRLEGPEDAPVVMFSNSLMCTYYMWDSQIADVSSQYRVLRYDTRGHGGTEVAPDPYSIEHFVDDAHGVLQGLGIERVHFVGLSLGGLIGQRLATKYPDSLISLVLCDTGTLMPTQDAWDERIRIAESEGMGGIAEPMLTRWITDGFLEREPDKVENIRSMILNTSVDGFIRCCKAIKATDLTDQVGDIAISTTVVYGAQDPLAGPSQAVHEGIDGSCCVVIDDAGHLPNVEQTETFNRTVLDHLKRHS